MRVRRAYRRVDAGKLRDGADIARSDGFYIFLLFAAHHDSFADALRVSGAHVDERGLRGDFAGEHLYVGEFADERVCNGLEDDGSRGGIFLNGNLNGVARLRLRRFPRPYPPRSGRASKGRP